VSHEVRRDSPFGPNDRAQLALPATGEDVTGPIEGFFCLDGAGETVRTN